MCLSALKKYFFFLISLIVFAPLVYAQNAKDSDPTKITIESAQNTEYRKDKASGKEEIVLSGNVVISVAKGSTSTKITADKVTFNRISDMLYATGNVILEQTGSSAGGQTITAESLLFNTSTLEGIFDDGRAVQTQSDAINLPSGSKLIVHSEIFGRSSSNTIAFKNAELTFCDDDDPHWKIWASRIWLLPGGEFAFFNALLFVGHVPLMYLPAFYYPKDELIFNPAFGFDDRKGYYFQTTTYLYGRKPLDTSSKSSSDDDDITKGLFNFMKSTTLKEQVREGLVLHNLDSDYKGSTSNYLKFMADYYTNLGFMVGLDGVFSPSGIISSLDASIRLGFSNTVFSTGGAYTDYYDNQTFSDSSNFMGFELPFRYSANLKFALSKPFSFSLSFPVYSDPYFTDDFSDRSEYIDWLGFLMGEGEDEESSSSSSISSFTWQASASYNVNLPDFIKPYVSSFSTNISSSVSFSSKERGSSYDTDFNDKPSDWRSYTPERKFFYPSQVSPFKISGSISGTIFSYPFTVQKSKSSASEFPVKLEVPDEFLTEEEKVKKEEERLKKLSEKENKDEQESSAEKKDEENVPEKKEETVLAESDLPLIQPSLSTTVQDFKGLEYSLTYSLSPQYSSEISYNSAELYKPEDFEWSNIYSSYYQVRVPVNLTSKLSYRSSFASMTNNFSFNPNFQNHPNLDGYKEEQKKNVRKTDYEARKLDLTNTNSVSIKPFIYSPVWKNTSISWNTTVKVIQTEFLGDADNPEWKYNLAELWDKDDFTAHTLSATISAEEGEYSQTLTLSTRLPPQIDEYTGTLKFGFPLASLSFSSGLRQKSANDETYGKLPFQQSASLKLFDKKLTLSESYNFKLEDWHSDSLKFSASYSGFSLSYTMSYIYGYDFDSDAKAWKKKTEQEFQPSSINFSYSTSGKTMYAWKNRITLSPALSTSISYDCLRPTNSSFRFVPSLTFKIHEFLDLTFSAESSNNVIFRYFQKYTDYGDVIPGETNPFVDLFNSFKFWSDDEFYDSNQTARKSSGFKVKTFKITVSHSLHDWDMAASLSFKPRTITENGKSTYDYSPYFSFGVTWRPLPSMKTQIVDEYGEWELNP